MGPNSACSEVGVTAAQSKDSPPQSALSAASSAKQTSGAESLRVRKLEMFQIKPHLGNT